MGNMKLFLIVISLVALCSALPGYSSDLPYDSKILTRRTESRRSDRLWFAVRVGSRVSRNLRTTAQEYHYLWRNRDWKNFAAGCGLGCRAGRRTNYCYRRHVRTEAASETLHLPRSTAARSIRAGFLEHPTAVCVVIANATRPDHRRRSPRRRSARHGAVYAQRPFR